MKLDVTPCYRRELELGMTANKEGTESEKSPAKHPALS
jgi:hypothetical protein